MLKFRWMRNRRVRVGDAAGKAKARFAHDRHASWYPFGRHRRTRGPARGARRRSMRSNPPALNATIEAARAGRRGAALPSSPMRSRRWQPRPRTSPPKEIRTYLDHAREKSGRSGGRYEAGGVIAVRLLVRFRAAVSRSPCLPAAPVRNELSKARYPLDTTMLTCIFIKLHLSSWRFLFESFESCFAEGGAHEPFEARFFSFTCFSPVDLHDDHAGYCWLL